MTQRSIYLLINLSFVYLYILDESQKDGMCTENFDNCYYEISHVVRPLKPRLVPLETFLITKCYYST